MRVLGFLWLVLIAGFSPPISANTCDTPDKSIESFLVQFADNKVFQRNRITYPMRITYMPPTSEDWVTEHWPRTRVDKIDWPLFLSSAELKKWGYVQTIPEKNGTQATVRHDSGGDAYLRIFKFHNHNGCWYLERLEDYSL